MKKFAFVCNGFNSGYLTEKRILEQIQEEGIKSLNELLCDNRILLLYNYDLQKNEIISSFSHYLNSHGFKKTYRYQLEDRFCHQLVRFMLKSLESNNEIYSLKKKEGWFAALKKMDPELIAKLQKRFLGSLYDTFADDIGDGDLGIIVCDLEIVRFLVLAIEKDFPIDSLKELDSLLVTKDGDVITVTAIDQLVASEI